MSICSRKFAIEHITRDNTAALTNEAARVSGIQYVMNVDQGKGERIPLRGACPQGAKRGNLIIVICNLEFVCNLLLDACDLISFAFRLLNSDS